MGAEILFFTSIVSKTDDCFLQVPIENKRSDDVIETSIKPALAFEQFAGKVFKERPKGAGFYLSSVSHQTK